MFIILTFCNNGVSWTVYPGVGAPTLAILQGYVGQTVAFPNLSNGSCISVSQTNSPCPSGCPPFINLIPNNVVGATAYLDCATCNAAEPPPQSSYTYLNSCDGLISYIVHPYSTQAYKDLLAGYGTTGSVIYLPNVDNKCFIVTNSLRPDHSIPYRLFNFQGDFVGLVESLNCDACLNEHQNEPRLYSVGNTCGCAEPSIMYFWYTGFLQTGFYSVPDFDLIIGEKACWQITEVNVIPNPLPPITSTPGSITQNTYEECQNSCPETIRGNILLTSCCTGNKIIVKDTGSTITISRIYHMSGILALFPDDGECYFAESTTQPFYPDPLNPIDINTIGGANTYDQPCLTCEETDQCVLKFPCPPPTCYTLIPCEPIYPTIISSTNLNNYVGVTVMINEVCYTVQAGSNNCTDAIEVEIFDSFTKCGDTSNMPDANGCVYCGCPPNYRRDDDICVKNDCYAPIVIGEVFPLELVVPGPNTWGSQGVRFYGDVSGYTYPLLGQSVPNQEFLDNNGFGSIIPYQTGNSLNTLQNRMLQVALWPNGTQLDNQWMGTVTCLNVTQTQAYSFGFAADEGVIIKQDGVVIFTAPYGAGNIAWRFWHVFQLTLTPGIYVFEIFVYNSNGPGGVAFEIYNVDNNTLAGINTGTTIDISYLAYSTSLAVLQGGSFIGSDNGYNCNPGYFITNCEEGQFQCCKILELPYIHCEPSYKIVSCVSGETTPDIITNTYLDSYVGTTQKVHFDGTGPWPEGDYCIQISEIPFNPEGVPISIIDPITFASCPACTKVCYSLTSCPIAGEEPTIIEVDNDLSSYIGQVIKFSRLGNTCWNITQNSYCTTGAITVPGLSEVFTTCETCNPIIPVTPSNTGRAIKPGYNTPGCPPEYTERILCTFSSQAYDQMVQSRYGIKICCDHDMDKWDVRKEILYLNSIFDPALCKSICPVPAIILTYNQTCSCEDITLDFTAEITGGSGSYQLQKLSDSQIWENVGTTTTGPSNGDIAITFIIDNCILKTSYRIIDVLSCNLISNIIILDINCNCIPSIVLAIEARCVQPLDGNAIFTLNIDYNCGSGDYSIHVFLHDWTSNPIPGPITGSIQFELTLLSIDGVDAIVFVVDNLMGTKSNQILVDVPNCSP